MVSENNCRDYLAGAACLLLTAALLASAPAAARVYKCTDDAGKVQYTDTPCGQEGTAIRSPSGPGAATPADKRMQKTRRLLDAMEAERREEKRLAEEARKEEEKRTKNCHRARDRYRQLISAGRLYELDEGGNRVVLNDQQRADVEANAKAQIQRWCE